MSTILVDDHRIRIPAWVNDLASFRRWADTEDLPEKAKIGFLYGEVWLDISKEQVFSHNQVKHKFAVTIEGLLDGNRKGFYFPDGVFFSNADAGIATNPDGVHVSRERLDPEQVRLVEGAREGFVEIEGSPDMMLEVVSDSSVEKDTEILYKAYAKAGVQEYWIVDARDEIAFDIHRLSAKGFTAVRKQAGWTKSGVFGRSFRFTRKLGPQGLPLFTLEVK